jgi:hypothetical protein
VCCDLSHDRDPSKTIHRELAMESAIVHTRA